MEEKFTRWIVGDNISSSKAALLIKKNSTIAVDTETTWVDDIMQVKLLTMQVFTGKESIFIDCRDEMPSVILNRMKTCKWICHNAKFDYQVIKLNLGYEHEDIEDTMIIAQILEQGLERYKGRFSLEGLVRRFVDEYAYTNQGDLFDYVTTKDIRKEFQFATKFTKEQVAYACKDVEYTYALYKVLYDRLVGEGLLDTYELIEKPFTLVLADMELTGLPLNREEWLKLIVTAKESVEEALVELSKVAEINWNSPKQVLVVFNELGVNTSYIDKKTGELKEGVNATVLSGNSTDIVVTYLRYKELTKLVNSYGSKFLSLVSKVDNRIHSSFLQMVDTARTSSSKPNIQNIPREIEYRSCFEEEDGYTLVIADYSSQEVLLAGDLYGESGILDAIKSGKDMHLNTASIVYGEEVTDKEDLRRQIAKTIIFTIIYGGGPGKIATQFKMPMMMASKAVKTVKELYPTLMAGLETNFQESLKRGYITTNKFSKRKIYLEGFEEYVRLRDMAVRFTECGWDVRPDLLNKLSSIESSYKRKSFNYPIQSSGADMAKRAGVHLRKASKEHNFQIVLLAHDEWVVRCKDEDSEKVAKILATCMKLAGKEILTNSEATAKAVISKKWNK